MADTEQKALPLPEDRLLLDKPVEERLRDEIEDLKRELEQERKNSRKEEHKPVRPKSSTLWLIGLALLVVLLLAFFLGWLPRHRREEKLAEEAKREEQALPIVNVMAAKRAPANTQLLLPGNVQAIVEAPLLARADGFLKKRYVDIGDRVRKGQLLGEIEAPDLDQQVAQGRAQLSQAAAAETQANSNLTQGKANEELARVSAVRWANLYKRGAVASQENDTYQTNYHAQQANVAALTQAVSGAQENVKAARANLDRLIALQSYEFVRAPFDGIVTYRNVDVGALIGTGSTLLFRVAQIDRLLTYIYVPQQNAGAVQVGQRAELVALELPNKHFTGTVTRTAKELDPNTRTLLTEIQLPNPDRILLPGMYVDVTLNSTNTAPSIIIPGDALLVRSNGTQVALAKEPPQDGQTRKLEQDERNRLQAQKPERDKQQNKNKKQNQGEQGEDQTVNVRVVHLQPVAVGRDFGTQIEILSGLQDGELVVVNPNDDVREGAKVNAQPAKQNADQQTKQGAKKQNGPGG
jgi:RND family efflux transporter MFP subunit